ncbi:MAG: efflux transporter outer membrane subunit [Deltaproteobacteria bacterium]|nr:efflux transporter outer membrane subunit [Deltaproteobacteria bacterium]
MNNSLEKYARLFPVGVALFFMIVMLTGCATVGPDYVVPDISSPAAWHSQLKNGIVGDEMEPGALARWWTTLGDPVLSGLIDRAVAGNLDVRKARARVCAARARRGLSKTDMFPTLEASGSIKKSRNNEQERKLYSTGFDAGWELDLFGGTRRSVEAAEAALQASGEDLRNVLVSLTAEVALNYVEFRMYQAQLATTGENLKLQQETYELTRWRYEAGLDDELAFQQARYNMESTRSEIPALRSSLEESKNRIAVLLGKQPGILHKELETKASIPVIPPEIAVGIPADILRRRPDVRKAERELAAQTARIGAATADLYPKFRLAGSIGLESGTSSDLFKTASKFWSIGPSISWNIFDAGAIHRNIEVQSALQEQYLNAYKAAVLNALEEVENALVAYAEEQNRRNSLNEAVQAAKRAVELSRIKYQSGMIDFARLLDAQRSLLSYQNQLVRSDGSVASNLIRLYKVLGGGWEASLAEKENKLRNQGMGNEGKT